MESAAGSGSVRADWIRQRRLLRGRSMDQPITQKDYLGFHHLPNYISSLGGTSLR
jgi:hypothetical protein